MIRDHRITCEDLADAYLERIERRGPELNCYLGVDHEDARARARQADRELARGLDRGPLHGIPVAVKDIFERSGRAVTAGSRPFSYTARRTATVVQRLHDAGAVVLGTLNLDEFAAGGTGANRHFGRCANPHDARYLTGGSSGGSAAAVAAGLAVAALGSDAGGSIRIPAAWCGVTGLKPTYGRVSRFGAVPRTWSMDCVGPLARTAADCALVLAAISGADVNDPTTSNPPTFSVRSPPAGLNGLRLGIDTACLHPCDPEIEGIWRDTLQRFEDLGGVAVPVRLPGLDLLNDLQQVIVKSEAAALHGAKMRHTPEEVSPEVRAVIEAGLALPATTYIEARALRAVLLAEFNDAVLRHCDALLMPVTPNTVPRHTSPEHDQPAIIETRFNESARFTRFANYLGLPAIAFPAGADAEAMPVGMQLVGAPWSEAELLDLTTIWQRATEFHDRVPAGHE